MNDNRPNIILIQSDQHRMDSVGINGHSIVRTPNMDRIAAEGINFTEAYCPIPMCVPTRNSHLTGQWPTTHGTIVNFDGEGFRPRESVPLSYANVLKNAGYDLTYVGRWHVDPHKTAIDFGFDHYYPDWWYNVWRRDAGIPRENSGGFFGSTDTHVPAEQSSLHWMADKTIGFLREMASNAHHSGRPFYLRWDMCEPHIPNTPPEPWASMYNPADIPPWPGFADTLAHKPSIQRQMQVTWAVDGYTWDQWAPMVARYFADISLLDAQIGRIMQALDDLGIAENTLLIYTSDHGDMCGSHGMIDKHHIMYDDVVKVPMMARWPARIQPGTTCDAFVSNSLDLPATYCDLAGAAIPRSFQGATMVPLLDGHGGNEREDIFCMYQGNQFGLYSQRMVRDRRWKYIWNPTAEDELYDLHTDPGELVNRAWQPDDDATAQIKRLRHRLVAWMEEAHDILLNRWTRNQLEQDKRL